MPEEQSGARLTRDVAHLEVVLHGQTPIVAQHIIHFLSISFSPARHSRSATSIVDRCSRLESPAGFVRFAYCAAVSSAYPQHSRPADPWGE
jgi:hypothetical protein